MRQHKQLNAKTLWGGGNFLVFIFTCSNSVSTSYTSTRRRRQHRQYHC